MKFEFNSIKELEAFIRWFEQRDRDAIDRYKMDITKYKGVEEK